MAQQQGAGINVPPILPGAGSWGDVAPARGEVGAARSTAPGLTPEGHGSRLLLLRSCSIGRLLLVITHVVACASSPRAFSEFPDLSRSLPPGCRDLRLPSPPSHGFPRVPTDTAGWEAVDGTYALYIAPSSENLTSASIREFGLELSTGPAPQAPPPLNSPQALGAGYLLGDLRGLAISEVAPPTATPYGNGYPIAVVRLPAFGSVVTGAGSLGLDSGVILWFATFNPAMLAGWWYDGGSWKHGAFCAVPRAGD